MCMWVYPSPRFRPAPLLHKRHLPRLVGASYPIQQGSSVRSVLRACTIQRSTFGCVAACVVPSRVGGAGGGGDEAGGGAEAAAVVVVGFAFVRAAGGFMAASSAMTGFGVMTVVEALPASLVCIELDSFTAIR